jgi:hypothetical protein
VSFFQAYVRVPATVIVERIGLASAADTQLLTGIMGPVWEQGESVGGPAIALFPILVTSTVVCC